MNIPQASQTPSNRRPYASRMPLEQRRAELLDAALRVSAREGYPGLTVQAVASEAGVTKPVLYGAFPTFPDLLAALLDREQAKATGQIMAALPLAIFGNPATLASRVTKAWVDALKKAPETWQLVLTAGPGTPPVVQERIEQGRQVVRGQIAALISSQVPADGGVDPGLLAQSLVATAEHFGREIITRPETVDIDKLCAMVQALATGAVAQARAVRARD